MNLDVECRTSCIDQKVVIRGRIPLGTWLVFPMRSKTFILLEDKRHKKSPSMTKHPPLDGIRIVGNGWRGFTFLTISSPTLTVPGHQRTVSTSKGCNHWLSLAKTLLKVALAGGNRSMVACTSKCGWAISTSLMAFQVTHL